MKAWKYTTRKYWRSFNRVYTRLKPVKGIIMEYTALKQEKHLKKPFFIRAEWDDIARVWVATSDDVPGLATEENTLEGLISKLKIMIPELLESNGLEDTDISFELFTRRFEIV